MISDIAQHTKNIEADNRVSLTVIQPSTTHVNVQSRGRVTYLGRAQKITKEEEVIISPQFTRYFPESTGFFEAHGFSYYRISIDCIRYIGGFGKIFWIEREEYLENNPLSIENENEIIRHIFQMG